MKRNNDGDHDGGKRSRSNNSNASGAGVIGQPHHHFHGSHPSFPAAPAAGAYGGAAGAAGASFEFNPHDPTGAYAAYYAAYPHAAVAAAAAAAAGAWGQYPGGAVNPGSYAPGLIGGFPHPQAQHLGHHAQSFLHGGAAAGVAGIPAFHPSMAAYQGHLLQQQSQPQHMHGGGGGGGGHGAGSGGSPNRTVYLGGLAPETTLEDVCNLVRGGLLEQIKLLADKNCVFISFVDVNAAISFHNVASINPLYLRGRSLKVGWGKANAVPSDIYQAVQKGATRALGISHISDPTVTKARLLDDFQRFGTIESVQMHPEQRSAVVYFASIKSAMQAATTLPQESGWSSFHYSFERDRCGGGASTPALSSASTSSHPPSNASASAASSSAAGSSGGTQDILNQSWSAGPTGSLTPSNYRTVYVGNLPRGITADVVCDNIRGGVIDEIKFIPEKCCAFVTFASAESALIFHSSAQKQTVIIGGREAKVGWGKPSAPTLEISEAIGAGATRVMYLAGLDPSVTEEHLRFNLGKYGAIDTIRCFPDQGAALISFMSISSAMSALAACAMDPMAEHYKLGYGRDRCSLSPAEKVTLQHVPYRAEEKKKKEVSSLSKIASSSADNTGAPGNSDSNNAGENRGNESSLGDESALDEPASAD